MSGLGPALFAGGGGEGGSSTAVFGKPTGDADLDGVFAKGSNVASAADAAPAVHVEIFKNGFRINKGEFRPTEGPSTTDANRTFLRAIGRREVPRELEASDGGDVDISVADMRGELYDPSKHGQPATAEAGAAAGRTAFSGAARSLGGSGSAAEARPEAEAAAATAALVPAPVVDPSLPTLTMAVRLASGRRSRVTLNAAHTVAQLRAHVASLDDCGGRPFDLLAGYPPTRLADEGATLAAAKLGGAAVTQRPC